MPRWLTGIAVIAAAVLLGASATMNYLFASSLGRTPMESLVLGVVSVGVDVLKAAIAVAIGYAARERRFGFVAIASMAFNLFTALSLTTALGFTASNRGAVTGAREQQKAKLTFTETKIGELRTRLRALPPSRPLSIVDEALAVSRTDPRWAASRQCQAAAPSAREFCDGIGKLRTERAVALEAKRLEDQLAAQEAEAERLRSAGSGQSIDPQAMALARALGLDEAQVQRLLLFLLSVVIEVASGIGFWLAIGSSAPAKPKPLPALELRPEPVKTEPVPPAPSISRPAEEPRPGIAVSVRSPPLRPVRRNGVKPPDGN